MPRTPRHTPVDALDIPVSKPKRLGTESHHCSQCNRPTGHKIFEHPDGVTMKCPCGYSFVDVRESDGSSKS